MSNSTLLPPLQKVLDQTLGACFVGFLFTAILYGVTCTQLYIYFTKNARDERILKSLIGVLWLLGTLQVMFLAMALYHYLITNFGNLGAALITYWSLPGVVAISATIECVVRGIFISRVWILSRSKWLTGVLALLNFMVFIVGIVFAHEAVENVYFTTFFTEGAWIIYLAFSTNCVLDVLVTATLMYHLFKIRYGFSSTTRFINKLIISILNSGLVTSVMSLLVLSLFAGNRQTFWFMGVYFPLSQVFYNALLASLNLRESLRDSTRRANEAGEAETTAADAEVRAHDGGAHRRMMQWRALRVPFLAGGQAHARDLSPSLPTTKEDVTHVEGGGVASLVPNRGPPYQGYPSAIPGKETIISM